MRSLAFHPINRVMNSIAPEDTVETDWTKKTEIRKAASQLPKRMACLGVGSGRTRKAQRIKRGAPTP